MKPIRVDSSGFTVVELLVSFSIIAVISSILLVGLNSARESARNMACKSNQRQIGIAITSYENTYRVLPINVVEEVGHPGRHSGPHSVENHSAHVRLLTFFDDATLMPKFEFNGRVHVFEEMKINSPPVFRCPSESITNPRSFNYCYSIGVKSSPSSFFKVHPSERVGAFGTSFTPIAVGQDGLSNLVYLSERSTGSNSRMKRTSYFHNELVDFEQGNGKRDWYSIFFQGESQRGFFTPNQWTQICARTLERKPKWVTSTGGWWVVGADAYFNQVSTPNSQIPDCGMLVYPMTGSRSARSEHAGQVNVLFGDGSVRSIDSDVDLDTWRLLGAVDKRTKPVVEP